MSTTATTSKKERISDRRTWVRRPGVLPGIVLCSIILAVVGAPILAPHDPDRQQLLLGALAPFSDASHPLGTDQLGRDILSRLLFGGQTALVIAALAAAFAGLLGMLLGVLAGYIGGYGDNILSRLTEIQLALPTILLAIVVIGMGATGLPVLVLILVLAEWPLFFRLSRDLTRSIRSLPFILAARSYGAGTARILVRHIARALLPTMTIAFTITLASAIALVSSLSYLGLGVQPPQSDWGAMVAQGQALLSSAWWISVPAGFAIAVFVYSANRLGDALAARFSVHGSEGVVSA